jgi:hypothetical protein
MTELQFQAKCYQHFHNNFVKHRGRLRRVKNELDNHPYKSKSDRIKQLGENKATGVIPGDSDFYFIAEKNHYIELKIDAAQSEDQKKFELLVTSFGHKYYICKTIEQFDNIIKNILNEEDKRTRTNIGLINDEAAFVL